MNSDLFGTDIYDHKKGTCESFDLDFEKSLLRERSPLIIFVLQIEKKYHKPPKRQSRDNVITNTNVS